MKPKSMPKQVTAFGYVRFEDGVYTAICVNLGLFAQGNTPEKAIKKIQKDICRYLEFVSTHHQVDWEKFLNRPAPKEFIDEFKRGLADMKKLAETKPANRGSQRQRYSIPSQTFAQEIPLACA